MTASDPAAAQLLRRLVWRRVLDEGSLEFVEVEALAGGLRIGGTLVGLEQDRPLAVAYRLESRPDGSLRSLELEQRWGAETRRLALARDAAGAWSRDGSPAPELAGCSDPDLGCSPSTNALPVRRLALPVGGSAEIRAAWIRFPGLTIEPSVQRYERLAERRWRYRSLASGFVAEIEVDALGLPTDYQGVWRRVADWSPGAAG
ncbi:hypothetical protein SAMN06265365_11877 [Tistlia consotensis]|uniref:Glycolipid-binding domain-containing protein n=1 Tax=Tistlia consotensis USBA 355 TaxID=560819 RepID=A0A1Y6CGJ2_9PROT|nr:putative glycolipid-binding domain-containing protein [Tistlia consotensis]SMF53958.1 hypothetical protein SAMN05428998_11978 [Tistlia consotensis USBA 355]SNR86289.1 hypothetical protein SAMN06265365_11877 [Tistlia consotensis]